MLKGLTKHEDKEQDNTKHEAPRRINHKATENMNDTGTTVLERSVTKTTVGFKEHFCCRQTSHWVPMYFLILIKICKTFSSYNGSVTQSELITMMKLRRVIWANPTSSLRARVKENY